MDKYQTGDDFKRQCPECGKQTMPWLFGARVSFARQDPMQYVCGCGTRWESPKTPYEKAVAGTRAMNPRLT
jgi:hypothetical protein